MQPGRISGSGRKENPFPERGACLRPGCASASNAGSGVRGRELKPGAHPRGKTKSPPTGLGKALHTQTFNEHANICK